MRDERGSASMLVVVHLTVLVLLGCALAAVAGLVVDQRRAQSAADLAALAGATSLARGADGCAAAGSSAAANDARLTGCTVSGRDVRVEVSVPGPRWLGRTPSLVGRARAGPG